MGVVIIGAPGPVILDPNKQTVINNLTVTSSSNSTAYAGFGCHEIHLVINITGPITGAGASITFTLKELDPVDQTTVIQSQSTAAISSTGVTTLVMPATFGDTFQVSWTVAGTSPSIGGTRVTLVGKATGAQLGIDSSGTLRSLLMDTTGRPQVASTAAADTAPATQNITTRDLASTTTVGANGQSIITGSPTASSAASFAVSSLETVQLQVTGTWTGTLQVEISEDSGTTWYIRRVHQPGTDIISPTFSANFSGGANVGGYTNIRVRATAAMTGTAVVKVAASVNANLIYVANAQRITDNAGNYMPAGDVAGRAVFQQLVDGTNGPAAVKAASVAAVATDPALVVALSPNSNNVELVTNTGSPVDIGTDNKLRVAEDGLEFYDAVEGASVNTLLWTQSTTTMTITQGTGVMTLNAGSSTANGTSAQITSNKRVLNLVEYPTYVQFRAKVVPQTNAVIEMGFFVASGTSAPTDGCLIRWTGTSIALVINFNGTETTTSVTAVLSNTTFYNFEIEVREDSVILDISDPNGSVASTTTLAIPQANSAPFAISHVPVSARVYDSAATGAAAQLIIGSVVAARRDFQREKPWNHVLAGMGRGTTTDPTTFAQAANWTNSTVPATAALSNTTPSYSTLGGQFAFAPVAGAETDFALFGYLVPTGFQAHITEVAISAWINGANNGATLQTFEWALAVNSNAASLTTGAPYPPIRVPIGVNFIAGSGNQGTAATPTLYIQFSTPLVCESGRYIHVILRVAHGATVGSASIRGTVTINGYFE